MIALCLGGAKTVFADLERARILTEGVTTLVVACNHVGIRYPGRLDAWVTLHPEWFSSWQNQRAANGLNGDYRAFIDDPRDCGRDEVVPQRWNGSSGLFAAQVSLDALGCSGAILCGIPMDPASGHIHWSGIWDHDWRYLPGVYHAHSERANIRSMSGRTADIFGRPEAAWVLKNEF